MCCSVLSWKLKKFLCRSLRLSFSAIFSSLGLGPENSIYLGLPRLPTLFLHLRDITGLQLCFHSPVHGMQILQTINWDQYRAQLIFFSLSGMTLSCLMSNVLKTLFFFTVFLLLFYTGGQIQFLLLHLVWKQNLYVTFLLPQSWHEAILFIFLQLTLFKYPQIILMLCQVTFSCTIRKNFLIFFCWLVRLKNFSSSWSNLLFLPCLENGVSLSPKFQMSQETINLKSIH